MSNADFEIREIRKELIVIVQDILMTGHELFDELLDLS